jgi:hypothetical protein
MKIQTKAPITKKTVILSKVDELVRELKRKRKMHSLIVLDKIKGRGINDLEDNLEYLVRRLEFDNYVVLEQFIKIQDTDIDDFLVSRVFYVDKEPKTWKAVIQK